MEELDRKRESWRIRLFMKFDKAVDKSISAFSWNEKAEFLELTLQYLRLVRAKDKAISDFFLEKILKPYKSKLKPAFAEKLFSSYFDMYFAWIELDIISTDEFNNLPEDQQGMTEDEFERYLNNVEGCIRQRLHLLYVYEHSFEHENDSERMDGFPISIKGRPARSAGDNLTKLNQEQTALLIYYLKMGRLILKNEYLTDKAAGTAFNILTGYSPNSLRTSLNEREVTLLHTKVNLTEVYNALLHITMLIDRELKPPKKT